MPEAIKLASGCNNPSPSFPACSFSGPERGDQAGKGPIASFRQAFSAHRANVSLDRLKRSKPSRASPGQGQPDYTLTPPHAKGSSGERAAQVPRPQRPTRSAASSWPGLQPGRSPAAHLRCAVSSLANRVGASARLCALGRGKNLVGAQPTPFLLQVENRPLKNPPQKRAVRIENHGQFSWRCD